MRLATVKGLQEWDFVRLVGVKHEVYEAMIEAVKTFWSPPKLCLGDQVLLCLMYWREYRTLSAIGFSYGVSETTAWRIVQKVEKALLTSGRFRLPGQKALHTPAWKNALVLIDATEVPAQRPKGKKQARFDSGKKKRHTSKVQVVSDKTTGQILATAFASGTTHNFALFKASRLWLDAEATELADSGYQGISKWHRQSHTPHKNTKLHPLTPEKKQANASLASQRVSCEHLFGDLKRFAILRGPYRNHLKWLALRFNLIAALQNLHLGKWSMYDFEFAFA